MALKIIFMGTSEFCSSNTKGNSFCLKHEILEVYTQPPTKSGRGQKINHSNVYNYSKQLKIKVRCPPENWNK